MDQGSTFSPRHWNSHRIVQNWHPVWKPNDHSRIHPKLAQFPNVVDWFHSWLWERGYLYKRVFPPTLFSSIQEKTTPCWRFATTTEAPALTGIGHDLFRLELRDFTFAPKVRRESLQPTRLVLGCHKPNKTSLHFPVVCETFQFLFGSLLGDSVGVSVNYVDWCY